MYRERKTVGFADLSNFLKLMDAVGEEQMVHHLQQAFLYAGDIILQHGGKIHKYLGDALLFSFPDPVEAVEAGRQIAQYQIEAEGVSVRFYVGLATGEVTIAEIGHPSKIEEDILGHTVNQAAILLKQARKAPDHLALSEETLKLVS